jgi:hypothetical protein
MHLPYIPKRFYKTPTADLGYVWDWARWLLKRGDTIASVVITADGLTVSEVSHAAGVVTAKIGGGVPKAKYTANCKITTTGLGAAGVLTNDRSIIITIRGM